MAENVLVGISGGVDSAVTALLLKRAGYNITGCRLILNEGASEEDGKSALNVADMLGIKLVTADFSKEFKENVSDYFISEYLNGRTPNPCVRCNPTVKFASLKAVADSMGIERIATGHYARITKDSDNGMYAVQTSPSKKDQSYFLYRLPQKMLCRTLFPLGEFSTKDEIREIGRKAGFIAADKKDSQEICFIPDNDYIGYIYNEKKTEPREGNFTDIDGNIIGRHKGIINYTVGQRKGLGAFGEPRYVKSINPNDNTVCLCKEQERFALTANAGNLFWTFGSSPDESRTYGVKIRSTAKPVEARLHISGECMTVNFSSPVLAPCPGQSAVVYDGNTVIGGGEIE